MDDEMRSKLEIVVRSLEDTLWAAGAYRQGSRMHPPGKRNLNFSLFSMPQFVIPVDFLRNIGEKLSD